MVGNKILSDDKIDKGRESEGEAGASALCTGRIEGESEDEGEPFRAL